MPQRMSVDKYAAILKAPTFARMFDVLDTFEDQRHWNVAGPLGRYTVMLNSQNIATVSYFRDVKAVIAKAYICD